MKIRILIHGFWHRFTDSCTDSWILESKYGRMYEDSLSCEPLVFNLTLCIHGYPCSVILLCLHVLYTASDVEEGGG